MPGQRPAGGGDSKIFDKVIVVTDRRVLDEQLRATVQQFENVPGTIVWESNSGGPGVGDPVMCEGCRQSVPRQRCSSFCEQA